MKKNVKFSIAFRNTFSKHATNVYANSNIVAYILILLFTEKINVFLTSVKR